MRIKCSELRGAVCGSVDTMSLVVSPQAAHVCWLLRHEKKHQQKNTQQDLPLACELLPACLGGFASLRSPSALAFTGYSEEL